MRTFRAVVLGLATVLFALPLVAMLEFSTRGADGREWTTWRTLLDVGTLRQEHPDLVDGLVTSLELAALTAALMLVLLVPTLVWVRLRAPRLQAVLEFLCLLPLSVPPVVLVVGLAPVYSWVVYFLGGSALTLTFAYVVLVLPFAFRSLVAGLGALDLPTLSEAARSLGAGWGTVVVRVVLPNLRRAVLGAAFLAIATVLGEFTFANLLNYVTLQTQINQLGKDDAQLSVAVSFATLLVGMALLLTLALLPTGRRRRRSS